MLLRFQSECILGVLKALCWTLCFLSSSVLGDWTNFTQGTSVTSSNIEQPVNSISDLDIQYPNLTAPFLNKLFQTHMANSTATKPQACGEHQVYDSQEKLCCSKCPRGQGVIIPCANRRGKSWDTQCEVCSDRKDDNGRILKFLDVEDHSTPCKTCSLCPKNSHETHRCNGTHNTKCACDKGFFSGDDWKPICQSCRVCPKGTYVAQSCGHTDTLCEECPKDTFSDRANADQCSPCKLCPFGVKMSRNCSKTDDRICAVTVSKGIQLNNPGLNSDTTENRLVSSGTNLIPVYCAIFGAIIVALIVYVILKRWKLCPGDKKKPAAKACGKNLASCNNNTENTNPGLLPFYSIRVAKNVGTSQHLIPLNYQQPIKVGGSARKSPKKSQGSNLSSLSASSAAESQKLLPQSMRQQNVGDKLSQSCLQELEIGLKDESDRQKLGETWVTLAKHLGYTTDTVSIRQESGALAIPPTRRLLSKWNADQNADVESFKRALASCGHSELGFLVDQDLVLSRAPGIGNC